MSEKITKRRIVELTRKIEIKTSDEFEKSIKSVIMQSPEAFQDKPKRTNKILKLAFATSAILVFAIFLRYSLFPRKAYADYYSLEKYDERKNVSLNPSTEFSKNQEKSCEMFGRFLKELPYSGKYSVENSAGDYSVYGHSADAFPDYYGGEYINVDGKLIVAIKESYFKEKYRKCEWYKELARVFNCEDFGCRPVKYNYAELMSAAAKICKEDVVQKFKEAGINNMTIGIDNYSNQVVISVESEEDKRIIQPFCEDDIYRIEVVGEFWW
ncbi:MAG: hypothetical protein K6F26_05620 [Lachnospiraceae bacterium]|nr:hypothetical protein [Lachnospiraceae bacterium]